MDEKRIIIYGGYTSGGYGGYNVTNQDSLYVLDLINFVWYVPKVSGKIPVNRYWHQANVIGKYMVISFGTYNI